MPIRAPLSWLREYIDINVPVDELARRLTLAGIEVEHVTTIGSEWENIYTGQVVKLERHPNADRLLLATITYGNAQNITVVTGAPNIEEGQKVVLGLLGCKYIDQHQDPPKMATLKPAKIRGVQTEGMVMSEAELALSEEHEGIIVLDPNTPLGLPASEVLGDTILHIEVTPNLGRILSMIGLAREIAALFGGQVRYPNTDWQAEGPPASELLDIEILDPDLCSRYTGGVIQGVKIGPSPKWMQRRLLMAGMRPVNNIVDITNYVMLEMGQPLHAFDYHAVEGHKIVVRRARKGERVVTLDHVERALDGNMLAICDVRKPVAIAGVMGGADSEIGNEGTADVLLESAHFAPLSVRRTARLLRLPSEASYRFERYVDPNLTVLAMKRAAELMRQLAGGRICEGYVDAYPRPKEPGHIHFYTEEVERLLGIKVQPSEIAEMLQRLEFKVDVPPNVDAIGYDTTMPVEVPTYRNDVTLPADLVEEIARMIGYDHIPETLLEGRLPPQERNRSREAGEDMRDIISACGLDEVITYGVTHSEELHKLARLEQTTDDGRRTTDSAGNNELAGSNIDNDKEATESIAHRPSSVVYTWDPQRPLVTIVNPVSQKQDVMRPTLMVNLLNSLRQNVKMLPEEPVRIFELGRVFLTRTGEEVEARIAEIEHEMESYPRMKTWGAAPGEERLPMELRRLTALMTGPRQTRTQFSPDNESEGAQIDFFDAKGVVEELLRRLHIPNVEWLPVHAPLYHPGRVALVRGGGADPSAGSGQALGVVGELHPNVVEEWEIPARRVAAFDLDAEALIRLVIEGQYRYEQISPYQPVRQDMAFVLEAAIPAGALAVAISRAGGQAVKDVTLFDIYTGPPIAEGQRSLAFAVTFSLPDKPLSEEEVARLRARIERTVERELGAKMRT